MTAVLSTPAGLAAAPPPPDGDGQPAATGANQLVLLAADIWAAAFAAVSVLGPDGPRIQEAHGFDPAAPPAVDALCERVVTERCLVVVSEAPVAALPGGGTGTGAVGMFAGAPIVTEAGELLGVLWVADGQPRGSVAGHLGQTLALIADKLAMRAELWSMRLQYESTLDLVGEAAFRCGADEMLTWVSPSWTTLTGYGAEVTLGQPLSRFLHGLGDTISEVVEGANPVHRLECRLYFADGSGVPVELAMTRFSSPDGGVCGVIGVVADLRERHQREVAARHDQKLESLGRLSAGIAHEINTPIQFVGDNTRFLANAYEEMLELLLVYRDCLDPSAAATSWEERNRRVAEAEMKADIDFLAEEVPGAVQQSLEGIERVASLVRAMKSFSYKDSNDRSYADLNEALKTTLTVARNEVKYVADVTLDLGDLPEVPCQVGDLNQVFLNLLVNAADAMQDKGERGEIRVTTRIEDSVVVISIADDGSGIPEHLHHTIFDPFFTTKEVGKGTGQGLALAKAVLEKHGGTIEVRSVMGQGTEFILRLPLDGKRIGRR
jgi:PAS domain S-box-containing protein